MGDPVFDAIAQPAGHHIGEIGEGEGSVAARPAAGIFERLRQIPMIKRQPGFDAAVQQPVDQAIVEGKAGLVHRAGSCRQDARPGHRKTIGADAERLHEIEVLLEVMIVIAGEGWRVAVADVPRLGGKRIPDRRTTTIDVRRAFDLKRGGGHAPTGNRQETVREWSEAFG